MKCLLLRTLLLLSTTQINAHPLWRRTRSSADSGALAHALQAQVIDRSAATYLKNQTISHTENTLTLQKTAHTFNRLANTNFSADASKSFTGAPLHLQATENSPIPSKALACNRFLRFLCFRTRSQLSALSQSQLGLKVKERKRRTAQLGTDKTLSTRGHWNSIQSFVKKAKSIFSRLDTLSQISRR